MALRLQASPHGAQTSVTGGSGIDKGEGFAGPGTSVTSDNHSPERRGEAARRPRVPDDRYA
jgi:hypothetical protein